VIKSISEWYENPKQIDEMKVWEHGELKLWEQEMCDKFPVGARILDIGCGAGREAFSLSKLGFHMVGIDISIEAISRAKRAAELHSSEVQFEVYDGDVIPFADESFDVVIIWAQTFGLLYGDIYKSKLLQECRRVLTVKGLFSYSGHSYQYIFDNYPYCLVNQKFYPYKDTKVYWETFNISQLEHFAEAEGFTVLESGEGEIYKKEDGIILYCLCQKGAN
jgi:ubiquinone/menaquinone biosynthesis C-methylase UbiE